MNKLKFTPAAHKQEAPPQRCYANVHVWKELNEAEASPNAPAAYRGFIFQRKLKIRLWARWTSVVFYETEAFSISSPTTDAQTHHQRKQEFNSEPCELCEVKLNNINLDDELTIVVSAMDPKLLMKMLQVTFTGGPAGGDRRRKRCIYT